MFGSKPLPLAVIKSTGISDFITSGLCTKKVSILACTSDKYSWLEAPLLLPPEPAALYPTADGRELKYLSSVNVCPIFE